jgi:[acyl-carrier-protein] S-malonyltransferase
VARLIDTAKARKARAILLKVSAPFHCALMQPAADRLASALQDVAIGALRIPVVANVDAEPNADSGRVADLLVRQVTHRVRWEASVTRVASMGVSGALEVGHGRVLAGLVRRIAKELRVSPVGSPSDIDVLKGGSDGHP